MAMSGWVNAPTDLRDERATFAAMTTAAGPVPAGPILLRLGRDAGFCSQGPHTGYADWRHPERPDPDIAVAIEGRLSNRHVLADQLGQCRVLASDADLLLHAYRRWGQFLVDRIDGVYAIAIWDQLRRQLLLIRDPLGVKTFFYQLMRDGSVAFATKIRGLLAHPRIEPVVTRDGLNELITLGPARTPGHAVINGMHELQPGHLTQVTPGRFRSHRHFHWQAEGPDTEIDEAAAATIVRRVVAESTAALRDQADTAVLLSGGIASAAAAACTTPNASIDVRRTAYTLTLAGPWGLPPGIGADVTAAARVARHLHLDYHLVTAGADLLTDLAAATRRIRDLPGDASLDAPLFALLSQAASTATGVITGAGANAVFGWDAPGSPGGIGFPWQRYDAAPVNLLSADARLHLLPTAYAKQRLGEAVAAIPAPAGVGETRRAWRRNAYLTLSQGLPAKLRRLDELASAVGLSVHSPLADWRLTEHTLRMPEPVRQLNGVRLGLLRHAVADLLPASVTWLPGRAFPGANLLPGWRADQRDRMLAVLADTSQPLQPLLDPDQIRPLLARTPEHAHARHSAIAYLLEINAWLTRHRIHLT
ncbi:asparagine synthetase B family protein [Paractinoplanes globisporus]|uniref:asparagine synthase (glutamine-hydrolyzing) n=1 Tax=Paractinoplanes globisporus TaxID=113565 RepID=A0ABW6WEV8_9ACTN|nr:asparagine synthase-related protein [Actinoplanes globisporus]